MIRASSYSKTTDFAKFTRRILQEKRATGFFSLLAFIIFVIVVVIVIFSFVVIIPFVVVAFVVVIIFVGVIIFVIISLVDPFIVFIIFVVSLSNIAANFKSGHVTSSARLKACETTRTMRPANSRPSYERSINS
ncbi:unnamed protein product [marine sediment metagenome]|uniref:Uncharacterized protein n=1 Tax=marine sediment metagenome TaxID=412755 RepID=X1KSJ6_9ZZZZ